MGDCNPWKHVLGPEFVRNDRESRYSWLRRWFCGDIFHEWNTRKAERFFKASGISKRNWRVYMRHAGLADGVNWALRAIVDDEGNIFHIRAWQIVRQTRENIERFSVAFKGMR